ncbi:unnamed protein product [Nippostrongylus brasiliensis]|uniref:P-type Cu(+) transporter n=1 Tax=Nippostrongylus brasiliensis TaxID=27835 RepID=A0A0N4XGA1_NIPBR|nr:unnamed protein product [Nippostrongylus brasiliensis]
MSNELTPERCLLDDSLLAPRPSVFSSARSGPSSSQASSEPMKNNDKRTIATISINGMTCHSCVNSIQDQVRSMPGIHSCKVSLENAEGVVEYDPAIWTGTSVAESIDDMGFEAKLKNTREGSTASASKPTRKKAVVSIKGMVCHACVDNIQEALKKRDGVISAEVFLDKEEGEFVFDPSVITAEQVVEAVDDAGYDPTLIRCEEVNDIPPRKRSVSPSGGSVVRFSKPGTVEMSLGKSQTNVELGHENLEKCTLAVDGMTCASCVQYIERRLGKLRGVQSVVVALIAGKAEIVYNPSLTSVEKLIAETTALGYRASLIDSPFSAFSKIHLMIGNLNSEADVNRIESHVISKKGVESCHVSLATSIASIEFSPSEIGPRDLISVVESLGYTAELSSKDDQLKRLDHSEEVRNLIFGIPVMLIMIVFHWILHTPMHPENQTPIFSPALSLDNLLLLLLCTPVQV